MFPRFAPIGTNWLLGAKRRTRGIEGQKSVHCVAWLRREVSKKQRRATRLIPRNKGWAFGIRP